MVKVFLNIWVSAPILSVVKIGFPMKTSEMQARNEGRLYGEARLMQSPPKRTAR